MERNPDGEIENIENIGSSIYADYVYKLRFDKRTGKISCICTSFKYRGKCHHISEFYHLLEKTKLLNSK